MAMLDTPTILRKSPREVSAADTIRQSLEDAIAEGHLVPGTRLEEVEVAARYGVSRTPVREALRMLAMSGLVDIERRKGAVVAALSTDRLIELFEAMSELEGVCGRLAARRISEPEIARLLRQHEICGEAARQASVDRSTDRFNSYYEENAIFHEIIYAAAHNAFLSEEVQALRRRLQPYRRLQLRMKGRVEESFAEHDGIVRAIASGNETAAADALRQHVSIQGDRFSDWVASVNSMLGGARRD